MIKKLPGLADRIGNPANVMAYMPTLHAMPTNTMAVLPTLAPYIIYMDNYFTSVALFTELRSIHVEHVVLHALKMGCLPSLLS
jgi:hypothetical protein